MIAVPKLEPRLRMKFCKPLAAAIWLGASPDRLIVIRGKKKQLMPTPMASRVSASVQKSTSGVKRALQNATRANTLKPKVATARASMRWMLAPTTGPSRSASTPPNATTLPAQSGV